MDTPHPILHNPAATRQCSVHAHDFTPADCTVSTSSLVGSLSYKVVLSGTPETADPPISPRAILFNSWSFKRFHPWGLMVSIQSLSHLHMSLGLPIWISDIMVAVWRCEEG